LDGKRLGTGVFPAKFGGDTNFLFIFAKINRKKFQISNFKFQMKIHRRKNM